MQVRRYDEGRRRITKFGDIVQNARSRQQFLTLPRILGMDGEANDAVSVYMAQWFFFLSDSSPRNLRKEERPSKRQIILVGVR